MKLRNPHKLAIIRREARGYTTAIPSKKIYSRKSRYIIKHTKKENYASSHTL